jgi:predicted enzyme related to lactoylglutathione lyase
MTDWQPPHGMTLQVQVDDIARARRFFGDIFGTAPEFEPHEDFLEWRVVPGAEVWFQVVGVPEVRPLTNRVRFRVPDVHRARRALRAASITPSEVTALPGVVRFLDFTDPWGNQLGYYEDIVPSGLQATVGGTVHDDAHFVTESDAP